MLITAMGSESKSKLVFKRGVVILLMSVIFLTSAFSVAALSKTAVINVDGEQVKINTMATEPEEILNIAEIKISDGDIVNCTDENGVVTVNVTRAFPVYIENNGKVSEYMVTGGTVGELLKNAGVVVSDNQMVVPDYSAKVKSGLTVKLLEYKTITVSVDGTTNERKVPVGTVANALEYLNILLSKNDVVNYNLTDEITDSMELVVTRVSYREITTTEKISFETEETYSDELEEGKTKVKIKGVDGEYTAVVKETIVDDVVVDTEYISHEITKEAVNEVVVIGTKKKDADKSDDEKDNQSDAKKDNDTVVNASKNESGNIFYDESGNAVSYSAVYHGSGTAYYAPAGSLTASGQEVYVGGVAVNPDIIPLGTKLYIVADDGFVYGYATAIDTGGALYDGSAIVDVFYYTYEECVQFGRRDVSVYVLD
ncbi:MAG: ubiquitin-like domain-containing protein [Acutalibacteraceae bacterium]|nr:ubiquitin-like domain-containing protein [Acutalibacteraceae bacterium]